MMLGTGRAPEMCTFAHQAPLNSQEALNRRKMPKMGQKIHLWLARLTEFSARVQSTGGLHGSFLEVLNNK
jgi:hypothetical protein